MQRHLAKQIEPHGVTLGMWYFLRALWTEDGQTQKELSTTVGTMEPTTLNAIKAMEAAGIVRRVRNDADRRKINIYLTPRGQDLRQILLPAAHNVIANATHGFSDEEREQLLRMLGAVQRNVSEELSKHANGNDDIAI
ncbi:MarR family winged helix-turn-helix transcriptional regulator [Actibacterium sp. D379-3]